jgi:hypothetical protein
MGPNTDNAWEHTVNDYSDRLVMGILVVIRYCRFTSTGIVLFPANKCVDGMKVVSFN